MKKTILAVLATLITATAWAKAPAIVGTIANRANGHIVLTSNPCPSDKEKLFAYVKEEGGRISVTGCWAWQDPKIFVFWQTGDVYEYDFSSVELSPEFIEFLKRNQSNDKET